ncbi:MAG TPA: DUF3455 domain-containing protein [Vicinamibacterales bacterium]|nr:DUF3455 domain-containing protein [Vicinamibacterales bacterium]
MASRYVGITHLRACVPMIVACAIGSGLSITTSAETRGSDGGAPSVPPNIEVPPGYTLFFKSRATGTQNYVCLPTASGAAWKFIAPQATLFDTFKGTIPVQLATHFLSANPSENGVPRPTWQHSFDSSRVWGRAIASSTDVNFVEPGAIPWLLLEAVGVAVGPAGGLFLTQTTFLQRVNTSGGVAPVTGCSQSGDVGALALVPYSADYFFYRARRDN